MQSNWNQRKKEIPSDIASIISTARVNNCWIFYEKSKSFFTPEEFERDWLKFYNTNNRSSNVKEFKIVNPLYAIRLAALWVNIANNKQQEIIHKMENYSAEFKLRK